MCVYVLFMLCFDFGLNLLEMKVFVFVIVTLQNEHFQCTGYTVTYWVITVETKVVCHYPVILSADLFNKLSNGTKAYIFNEVHS